MKPEQILKTLKLLGSAIEPDPAFLRRSRDLILASSSATSLAFRFRQLALGSVQLAASMALMALLLFVVAGGLNRQPSPTVLASLNEKTLRRESANVSFNIELAEISYRQEFEKNISLALDVIIEDQN